VFVLAITQSPPVSVSLATSFDHVHRMLIRYAVPSLQATNGAVRERCRIQQTTSIASAARRNVAILVALRPVVRSRSSPSCWKLSVVGNTYTGTGTPPA
jgi:hypothetical protein